MPTRFWLGCASAVAGTAVLAGDASGAAATGDALAAASGVLWAAYILAGRDARARASARRRGRPAYAPPRRASSRPRSLEGRRAVGLSADKHHCSSPVLSSARRWWATRACLRREGITSPRARSRR